MDSTTLNSTVMNSTDVVCFEKIKGLYETYEKVKLTIIYAENFDPKQELYLAPINQLRSALDHLFKAIAFPDDIEYELKEVKEHLDRAGYDAFELFASNLGLTIIKKLGKYPTDVLSIVFPDYFQVIKPKLIEIRSKLAEIRKSKKSNNIDSFSSYFSQIEVLLDFDKKVEYTIPAIEEFNQKKIKEKRKERIFNAVVIGIISAVAGGIIVYFITAFITSCFQNK